MSDFLVSQQLNNPQYDAVTSTEGPLLVLAGAGTGKTRVLTTRIAHIIKSRLAYPSEILAVTFTNKAASEMKHRIQLLCENSESVNAGTFHSISARILRQYADIVGLSSNFTIIDADDQLKAVKSILQELYPNNKDISAKHILSIISRWKDLGIRYNQVSQSDIKTDTHKIANQVYLIYQKKLNSSNLCDFGDLLLYNIQIFLENSEILSRLQNRFKYILIDEYQDTNAVQYLWSRLLADKHKNICCVGDDDQSIYSWRGAEITNILRFEKDFHGSKIIALEQNYRSTTHILSAASNLIKNNQSRHSKTLWTNSDKGEPIRIISCYNDKEEAKFIANNILKSQTKLSHIAVLVRAGFQTRAFEEAFINTGISYRIIGGLRFYERAEVKDIIAYIRLTINHKDDVAFERIINNPKRSIGPSTILSIKNFAQENNLSYFDSIKKMLELNIFKNKLRESIDTFTKLISYFSSISSSEHGTSDFVKTILEQSGYKNMLKSEKTDEARGRLDNINELIRAVDEYNSIQEFIEHASLVMDNESEHDADNNVNVMTIHASKGLEFDTVFIPGMEEGLFPHQKSLNEEGAKGLEEERRIAYVAITRAKRILFLLYADTRRIFHEFVQSIPSRFLGELPKDIVVKSTSTNLYSSFKEPREIFSHKKTEIPLEPVRPGTRVSHVSFGSGIILKKNSDNLEILFDSSGIKTIKESFIKLID